MNIFDYLDYKHYVRDHVLQLPNRGYGEYRRIAEAIKISTVLTSQIFNGDRDLSFDQAFALSKYLQLSETDKNYFLLLVQYQRAVAHDYKSFLHKQITEKQQESKNLSSKIRSEKNLSEQAKAIYYSDWAYSAMRLAVDIHPNLSLEDLSKRLKVNPEFISEVIQFLLNHGLIEQRQGQLHMTQKKLHLDAKSPYVKHRQIQWRLKAIEQMNGFNIDHLWYTAPMTLDYKTYQQIRKSLVDLIESTTDKVVSAPSEQLACLNIDLFSF